MTDLVNRKTTFSAYKPKDGLVPFLTLISVSTNWQATPQAKPSVDGQTMATVVGPKGEEIYCDALYKGWAA